MEVSRSTSVADLCWLAVFLEVFQPRTLQLSVRRDDGLRKLVEAGAVAKLHGTPAVLLQLCETSFYAIDVGELEVVVTDAPGW